MKLSDSIFSTIREMNRKYLHSLWRRAQEGQLDGLSEEERQLVGIMLDHSDIYFNQFEFADVLADHEFDPEREANPFLHITLHAVAENQINNRDPVEAFQFYNAMIHNQCSRHEALHLLMRVMIRFMFPVFAKGEAFDLKGYCKFLRIGRKMKPEKIIALLESEPDFSEEGEIGEKSQMIKELQSGMSGHDSDSVKENSLFLDTWVRERNERPLPEFLGLSPDQMHRMLYYPFLKTSDIVTLNVNLSREKI